MSTQANKTKIDLDIRPFSKAPLGAEVRGIDLSKPLSKETQATVYKSFLKHQLLVFKDQKLTKQEQVEFSKQFGELERHTLRNRGQEDEPLVHVVSNLGPDGKPTGKVNSDMWHTDKSFRPLPSMATILHAQVLPPNGGDTCFANMYAAYEALSESEKETLDDVKVVHSWELSRENIGRVMSEEEKRDAPTNAWPLARVHPETGRKALFMGMHASHIEGRPLVEGRAKIIALEEHATQQKFCHRHTWQSGDVLMWDNRCLLHRADPNFDASLHPRILHRTCLRGTTPA
jgi:taurine dioxygenase